MVHQFVKRSLLALWKYVNDSPGVSRRVLLDDCSVVETQELYLKLLYVGKYVARRNSNSSEKSEGNPRLENLLSVM